MLPAAERTRLLCAPYTAPALSVGSRATCLFRDCDVVITSWTDAPISWPRCRAADQKGGGGSGLLVDEELVRAVRSESAAAVCYWWGVTHNTIWKWRKVLGVGARDTEGSRRLYEAASEATGQALTGRKLPPEEVDQRRRQAIALNLKKSLEPFQQPAVWSPEELAELGTAPDRVVAENIGRERSSVRRKRVELGVPKFRRPRPEPVDVGLPVLSRADKIAAAKRGKPRPRHVIEAMRQANLGRKASDETRARMSATHRTRGTHPPAAGRPFTPDEDAILGTATDREIAERLGRHKVTIAARRRKFGIPNYRSKVGYGGRHRLEGPEAR